MGFKKDILLFLSLLFVFGALFAGIFGKTGITPGFWSIDVNDCSGCGGCATNCVKPESAVKAVMNQKLCPNREDCPAFFKKGSPLEESQENQICPTGALIREQVNDSIYRYTIDEKKCIGCGSCTSLCQRKCDGALSLVIDTQECVDCNKCDIAKKCPTDAVHRTTEIRDTAKGEEK